MHIGLSYTLCFAQSQIQALGLSVEGFKYMPTSEKEVSKVLEVFVMERVSTSKHVFLQEW
jgi:hypothetical protein